MPDIGSTLREARMRARIDISEVEARTKIRAKYLRAIENEEWDLLPGQIYVKSFLRTYGDFLGLDSRMLIDEFKRRYERPSETELRPIALRERDRPARGPVLPPQAVIGLVLAVLLVVLYVVGSNATKSSTPPPAASHTPRGHHVTHRPQPTPTTTTAAPQLARLSLVPTGPVYVCLVDGSGKKLINQRTFAVGDHIPTETAPKLLLTLGNASVRMTVDGTVVPVAPSAAAIRFLIGPTGARHIPLSATPTCP